MIPRPALVAAVMLIAATPAAAQPARLADAGTRAAAMLARSYMQHVACTAKRTGLGAITVAEMTWDQAKAADRAFRRRHHRSILAALRIDDGRTLLSPQAKVQRMVAALAGEQEQKLCSRAAAHFLAAVTATAVERSEGRVAAPAVASHAPLPPPRPKFPVIKLSGL
jgi:hypothetical protein